MPLAIIVLRKQHRPGSHGCDTAPEEETRRRSDSSICQTEEGVSSSTRVGTPVVKTHLAALRRLQRDGSSLARKSSVIPGRRGCQDSNRRCGDRDRKQKTQTWPERGCVSELGSEGLLFQWSILGRMRKQLMLRVCTCCLPGNHKPSILKRLFEQCRKTCALQGVRHGCFALLHPSNVVAVCFGTQRLGTACRRAYSQTKQTAVLRK